MRSGDRSLSVRGLVQRLRLKMHCFQGRAGNRQGGQAVRSVGCGRWSAERASWSCG